MTMNGNCKAKMMPKPTPFSSLLLYTCLFLILHCHPVIGFIRKFQTTTTRAPPLSLSASPTPIPASGWPEKFPAKEHCSKCGLCETKFVSQVTNVCAFLNEGMARIDDLEEVVHFRKRHADISMAWSDNTPKKNTEADEGRFGVLHQPMMLARGVGIPEAQWAGCVTGIALAMLESQMVDAVVCIANKNNNNSSWSSPEPIVAKTREDVLRGRGVKPALAPSLRVLDEIQHDESIRKLLFCGVGCAVQAFRSIQDQLGLEQVYVLGTNCADNSPTPEAAQNLFKLEFNSTLPTFEAMNLCKISVCISRPMTITMSTFENPTLRFQEPLPRNPLLPRVWHVLIIPMLLPMLWWDTWRHLCNTILAWIHRSKPLPFAMHEELKWCKLLYIPTSCN